MKIGISTFVMQGGRSGIATYIRNLVPALSEVDRNNKYELLMARDEAGLIELSCSNFSKRLYAPVCNRPVLNLALHNIGLPQKKYDLLHIPSYRRIPLLKRTRIVATVHDLAAFSVDAKYDRARMFFSRRMVPHMIRRADHVITVSHHTRDDLVRLIGYPEDRISVIYPGINHALFKPIPPPAAHADLEQRFGLSQPFLVYVSRLEHPAKNHLRLIEAFERLKLESDSAHQLVFAGADWHGAEAIHQRIAASPVRNEIHALGFVEETVLPLLYSACDLMIYPSLFEGFGLPVIEALACGAPVICSNSSALRELAEGRLLTFNPESSDELYQAVAHALAHGTREQQAQNLEYAASFNWKTTAEHTLNIYQTLI